MYLLRHEFASRPALWTLLGIASTLIVWFTGNLIFWRRYFRRLRSQGLPMPPHNIILGHVPVLIRAVAQLPGDAHPFYMSHQIRQMYPDLGPNFYLDLWPFADSMLVLGTPAVMHQIAFDRVLGKNDILRKYLFPLTEGMDIVSMNGPSWKKWRAVFNPGFSPAHLMTLTSVIVKETEVYCTMLDERVKKGEAFKMKQLTDNLILDVIGQVALGVRFDCQRVHNKVIHSLRTQIKWLSTGIEPNVFARYNPIRPIIHWYHGAIVNQYVLTELNKKFNAWYNERSNGSATTKGNRTAIDLAINAYADSLPTGLDLSKTVIDPTFKKVCQSQLKVFLFSGHDTTSSAICFHLWLLSQNPAALRRLQDEHTKVFGPDPAAAAEMISTSSHLLNQLPYTTAVIKESLRIYPTVTVSRMGEPGFSVVDDQGRAYPTDNLVVWPNQQSCHRDPAYWPDPESFLPERWLVGPDDPLHPVKGMWRPFDQGPRGCIAQELAMIEMKIVLVLVSRTYRFVSAYGEGGEESPLVLGRKAYQVEEMGPKGGMPMRVERIVA